MEISSKLSLYDFLTMMVTGFLLLLLLTGAPEASTSSVEYIIFFIACYIIGIIYHKLVEKVCGLCCGKAKSGVRHFTSPFGRNNPDSIRQSKCSFYKILSKIRGKDEDEYYRKYYLLMQNGCLNNIPILEAQVAFIRNLIPVLSLYVIVIYFKCCCCRCGINELISNLFGCPYIVAAILVVIIILLFFAGGSIQMKIQYLVFEGGHYIEEIENNKANKVSNINGTVNGTAHSATKRVIANVTGDINGTITSK